MRNAKNLFGTDWMEEFDLLNVPINTFCYKIDGTMTNSDKLKKELKIKFPEIFSEELGFCSKVKAKFDVKENIMLVFCSRRTVPYASVEIIDKELERLEKLGVIEKKLLHPRAAPVVYVKKKKIRICTDYSTRLNDCLKEINYPLRWEEIFANLNGGHIFSKLDLSEAYLKIPVEEKYAELLTINTHRGLFKMNRLQYGIKVAPSIFQKIMDTMLVDLDFATAYLDDILIKSKNREDLGKHVTEVFKK